VVVDIDPLSKSFGEWIGVTLSDENHHQIWIPPGYAHGFVVLSEVADVEYKCTDYYHPDDEAGLFWNDPDVGIDWPVHNPQLSDKDQRLPMLSELRGPQ
jgi:dTDP-4-dehydrorhamnose 3,5-epimerase